MKNIKFLARNLTVFSFNDIFMMAEMLKEELQEKLNKMSKENILNKTTQGHIYCDFNYMPPPTTPTVKGEYVKFSEKHYGKRKSFST